MPTDVQRDVERWLRRQGMTWTDVGHLAIMAAVSWFGAWVFFTDHDEESEPRLRRRSSLKGRVRPQVSWTRGRSRRRSR